jgi:hypothetical protein
MVVAPPHPRSSTGSGRESDVTLIAWRLQATIMAPPSHTREALPGGYTKRTAISITAAFRRGSISLQAGRHGAEAAEWGLPFCYSDARC